MKNLKMRTKLLLSFGIVIALVAAMGITAIVSTGALDTSYSNVLSEELPMLYYAGDSSTSVARQRSNMRAMLVYMLLDDQEHLKTNETALHDYMDLFEEEKAGFISLAQASGDAILTSSVDKINQHSAAVKKYIEDFMAAVEAGDEETALLMLQESGTDFDTLQQDIMDIYTHIMEVAESLNDANTDQYHASVAALVAVLAIVLIVSVSIAFYLATIISTPLKKMQAVVEQAGTTGSLDFSAETIRGIEAEIGYRDELGTSLKSFHAMMLHFLEINQELGYMAQGDMSRTVKTLSPTDTMGNAMNNLIDSINSMFSEISMSSAQVSTGSTQIADGAQSLAQGATEQASSVQELSSSIAEVAASIKLAAESAQSAADLAGDIKGKAERGSVQMSGMIEAVREINEASQSISRVISVIDNIAFQTNILALNASVEAAKAGQHGRGFAVVAEEVRSLATKSAEAAKDTSSLIASSIEKAELGTRIAGETSASLGEIVEGINQSSVIVTEIARSAEEQATAISQINVGIDQVAQVVQQNSATAQESAAASQEMSSQSNVLQELVSRFQLKDGTSGQRALPMSSSSRTREIPSRTRGASPSPTPTQRISGNGNGYGKY